MSNGEAGGEYEEKLPREGEEAEAEDEYGAPEYLELSPEQAAQEAALARATLRRIERMILAAGGLCGAAAAWPLGGVVAVGILLGTLLGWLNFRWLAASVNAVGERIARASDEPRRAASGASIMVRGIGRIVLIALVAYGIFAWSLHALVGFLAGLAMPVAAMMCEAAYEFAAGRRPS